MKRPVDILVIEDNEGDIKLIKKTFQCTPPECVLEFAEDGETALKRLFPAQMENDFAYPDMIILDLNIPGVSGLEVLQKLRSDSRTSTIPVIVLTSSDSEKDVQRAYQAGACAYLCKPVDLDTFITSMQNTYRFWLQTNTFNGRRCHNTT